MSQRTHSERHLRADLGAKAGVGCRQGIAGCLLGEGVLLGGASPGEHQPSAAPHGGRPGVPQPAFVSLFSPTNLLSAQSTLPSAFPLALSTAWLAFFLQRGTREGCSFFASVSLLVSNHIYLCRLRPSALLGIVIKEALCRQRLGFSPSPSAPFHVVSFT